MNALLIAISIVAVSTALADSLPKRDLNSGQFDFVGFGTLKDSEPHCTFTIVKHGLLLTAKHCFTHTEKISLPKFSGIFFPNGKKIAGDQINEIILDSGENDIAWVRYNPESSAGKIDLPEIILSKELPTTVEKLQVPGSPYYRTRIRDFVVVTNCLLTGKSGTFDPMPLDPGYEGLLFEMNCPAWYGQSGSPIIGRSQKGSVTIFGVLSHTFDVLEDGSLNPAVIARDNLGRYLPRTMFSPLQLSNF